MGREGTQWRTLQRRQANSYKDYNETIESMAIEGAAGLCYHKINRKHRF